MTLWREIIETGDSGLRPGAPSSDEQLDAAEERLGVPIPSELRDLYRYADGIFDEPGQWFVVWPVARMVINNLSLRGSVGLPTGLLAFGDDGAGDPFCVEPRSNDDRTVLVFSCIESEARPVAPDLEAFWRDWRSGANSH